MTTPAELRTQIVTLEQQIAAGDQRPESARHLAALRTELALATPTTTTTTPMPAGRTVSRTPTAPAPSPPPPPVDPLEASRGLLARLAIDVRALLQHRTPAEVAACRRVITQLEGAPLMTRDTGARDLFRDLKRQVADMEGAQAPA